MDNNLANVLLSKNIFTRGMELEIYYQGRALGGVNTVKTTGRFLIDSIVRTSDNRVVFIVSGTQSIERKRADAEQVILIEGQDPERFAAAYDIMPDGGNKILGKRRGRIPKHIKAQMLLDQQNDIDNSNLTED